MKCVGILGGMGPEATALFYRRVVALTSANRDQDHIPVVMVADPRIPDRTSFLEGRGPSPLSALIAAAKKLEGAGADFIVIPCNTAHFFWNEVQASIKIRILHIVKETARTIAEELPKGSRLAILATRGTAESKMYQEALVPKGFEPMSPTVEIQAQIQSIIENVKNGGPKRELEENFSEMITHFSARGANGAILGCTELPLLLGSNRFELRLFDSLQILAEATVRAATE